MPVRFSNTRMHEQEDGRLSLSLSRLSFFLERVSRQHTTGVDRWCVCFFFPHLDREVARPRTLSIGINIHTYIFLSTHCACRLFSVHHESQT